ERLEEGAGGEDDHAGEGGEGLRLVVAHIRQEASDDLGVVGLAEVFVVPAIGAAATRGAPMLTADTHTPATGAGAAPHRHELPPTRCEGERKPSGRWPFPFPCPLPDGCSS